jgi:hypothetical protein
MFDTPHFHQGKKFYYCTILVDNGAPGSSGVETGFPGDFTVTVE